MFSLRQFTGWLALLIASAGPVPLWTHHAWCHTNLCCAHDGSEQVAHSHAGHSHGEQCGHVHQHRATSTVKNSLDDSAGLKPVGLSGKSAEHDCFVCYQLSQAASSAVGFSVEIYSLPPIASSNATGEDSIATLCGWHSPRGPPSV